MSPPTEEPRWCQETEKLNLDFFPTGCSNFNMGKKSGPFDRLFIFPDAKLAFCGIPKAGITQWLQFLRFTFGAKDYQSNPHYKRDKEALRFDSMRPEVQISILKDPSWTRAVFIREPAERLLSAYLDKVQRQENITFPEFIEAIAATQDAKAAKGMLKTINPHWRSQAFSCGLSHMMPHFNFVASLDNAANHTKALLKQVGLWDIYGRYYRTSKKENLIGQHSEMILPPASTEPATHGFQQKLVDTTGHNKGSSKMLNDFYTPDLMEKVKTLYAADFSLWNALQLASKNGTVTGSKLASLLNPDCT